ncbi:two-component sensor histidine kinase [Paucibacter sp. KBW04]|uniref:sensor histidine kinase n=1 Tax=Paucibacter sp. KBW04 TaxID=2153361 RepID=UPI000F5659C4|nr:ATP-binding protein [Paucibacter sp. KBW04]RQO61143.1 two-component sensor histidine kinase [Paucibacter sp. KBW04]
MNVFINWRQRSLLRRLLLGFSGVMLVAWLGLLAYEVYNLRHNHARGAEVWNRRINEKTLLTLQHLDLQKVNLPAYLNGTEAITREAYKDTHDLPPGVHLQIWLDGRQIFSSEAGKGLDSPTPEGWVSHRLSGPARLDDASGGRLELRRDQEIWGGWFLSLGGLAYFLRPLLYCLPFLLLPALLLVRRGLAPLRDIGAQIEHRSVQDLTPLPESPYAELSPVVRAVNRLMQRLQEGLDREREFLQDAAHELKTPLAVVQMNGESLLGCSSPEARVAIQQRLREGVERATHMAAQLLALARSRADLLEQQLREQDLSALLRQRLALLEPLAHKQGMELELDAPEHCPLLLHRETLCSLIDNLVDNAIQYAREGGWVKISLRADTEGEEPGWLLCVSDQGPGIPPEQRQRVFERFYRLAGQEQPGSGLGLSIAERAAAQHGGTVTLDSGPQGRGLTVTVRLPCQAEQGIVAQGSQAAHPARSLRRGIQGFRFRRSSAL